MMRKTLVVLALLSVGCTHAARLEAEALKLYPLTKVDTSGACTFQLKGTKSPNIMHFVQIGVCLPYDEKGLPADLKDCSARSVININNNQMVLRNMLQDGELYSALYKNDDYVAEIKSKERDCDNKKVSCAPFYLDAVLTVKKGSQQQTFDMQGSCEFGDE